MPLITTSAGRTRIRLEGATIWGSPTVSLRTKKPPKNNHETAFGVVYANDAAARVLLALAPGKFPVGSVIVREKLANANAKKPELLAAMIKREAGFNPAGGDWEFLIFDSELTRVRERQKKGSCLACHSSQQSRDFVFPVPQSPD